MAKLISADAARESIEKVREAIAKAELISTQPFRRMEHKYRVTPSWIVTHKYYAFDNGIYLSICKRQSMRGKKIYIDLPEEEKEDFADVWARAFFGGLVEDLELAEQGKQNLYIRMDKVTDYVIMRVTDEEDGKGHNATQEELAMLRTALDHEMKKCKSNLTR